MVRQQFRGRPYRMIADRYSAGVQLVVAKPPKNLTQQAGIDLKVERHAWCTYYWPLVGWLNCYPFPVRGSCLLGW